MSAQPSDLTRGGVDRRSRLHPDGTRLAHADLHNHTLLSDGRGAPERAFASMRAAGLDAAALTDHASIGFGALSRVDPCAAVGDPQPGAQDRCRAAVGMNEAGWERSGRIADAADDPGAFVALRGFEWTHPTLGHMNVWGSSRWIDALHTVGIGWDGLGQEARRLPGIGALVERILAALPGDPGMRPVYDWLATEPTHPGRGGGLDGLAGFNHPGREPGWFDAFRHDPRVAGRMVSLELFNKTEDFLFDDRGSSPLVTCLDAGWRVGLIGVSDEHGDDWGVPEGKGRAGLWVTELTRAGVRAALEARRMFATNRRDVRLDATANGVRMGGVVPHGRGPVDFAVDLDPGPERRGGPLQIQVLRPASPGDPGVPTVAHLQDVTPGVEGSGSGDGVLRFTVDLDVDDGAWVVLRIADPDAANTRPGPPGHPANARALAYASPFWLDPDLDPAGA